MSFFSWFQKKKASTAFSCDNGYLRFVTLTKKNGLMNIEHYGSLWLGPEIVDHNDHIHNEILFIDALKQVSKKYNIQDANIVVPDHQATLFHTHVTKESAREMEDVITDHITTYCKVHGLLSYSEYVCEYDIINESSHGYDIHVTLVPKEYLNKIEYLFKQATIQVYHIETAHHAVARSCLGLPIGRGYLAIFIGDRVTTITTVHGYHAVAHARVHIGVNHIITTLKKFLGASDEEAEKILEKYGVLKTHPDVGLLGELYVALEPLWHAIHEQIIEHGLLPYKTFGDRFALEKMVVYGEGVRIKGIAPFLAEKIEVPCILLDVWQGRSELRVPVVQLPADQTCVYAEPLSLALLYLN